MTNVTYLDHAATSWPKPPEVVAAMARFLERDGGNPGRAGHRLSVAAGRVVYEARELLAGLFNAPDPLRVIFASNATHAVNIAICGLVRPGDHVITSGVEHNAVMRPLRALEQGGVRLTVIPCSGDGTLDLDAFARAAESAPPRLVAVTHASNVMGAILPVAEVGAVARRTGAYLLVDAAQTAGTVPIDMQAMGIDLVAFTGHKGLQGPPGTGGLVIGGRVPVHEMTPLTRGGTGSRSESENQPEDCPDKFESGTLNGAGIAGLGAGVRFVMERGVHALRAHEIALARKLAEGLANVPGVALHGPGDWERRTAVVSLTSDRLSASEIGFRLDEEFGVLSRVGLHCAPAAHRTIGTFPEGTVRFAPGPGNTPEEIDAAVKAVARILG
ncbi:MAG: aminotransferase class V-fold PLP-dependent enzyme [Acidobacteriota bacterium]|jgi:cysteine desulfurase family protein|nr:aminotransferase class V-fold PLP-dependent enzyme [Acidobacteriota bacterium]